MHRWVNGGRTMDMVTFFPPKKVILGNTRAQTNVTDSFRGVIKGKQVPEGWECKAETFVLDGQLVCFLNRD